MDISIIIPTYNRLWSLNKAIESCKETALSYEIIVVDDGSTDGTAEWLRQQQGIVAIIKANEGKDWSVNKAMAVAKGKYIRFLDSDDWLLPHSSDELFAKAEAESLDVVAAGHSLFSEDEKYIRDINWVVCDDFIAQQLGECDSSHYSAYLFRREFILPIPHRQEYGARDDRQFIIEVALANPKTGSVVKPTLAHRLHTQDKLQKADGLKEAYIHQATLNIYRNAIKTLEKRGELTQRHKNAAVKILWPLAHWVAKRHIKSAEEIYNWIKELDPAFVIPDKGLNGLLFKTLGFSGAEKFLRIRRFLKYGFQ